MSEIKGLTIPEAATEKKVSKSTIKRWIAQKKIDSKQLKKGQTVFVIVNERFQQAELTRKKLGIIYPVSREDAIQPTAEAYRIPASSKQPEVYSIPAESTVLTKLVEGQKEILDKLHILERIKYEYLGVVVLAAIVAAVVYSIITRSGI